MKYQMMYKCARICLHEVGASYVKRLFLAIGDIHFQKMPTLDRILPNLFTPSFLCDRFAKAILTRTSEACVKKDLKCRQLCTHAKISVLQEKKRHLKER